MGITGNLDWRQNWQKEGTKTKRKTAALSLALLLGPHRSPGTLARKRSPLHVFNKCHLTWGGGFSPCFGGMRTCSGFGQLAGPISTLAGGIGDFMAVCPPWCFSSASCPTCVNSFFPSLSWFTKIFVTFDEIINRTFNILYVSIEQ